MRRLLLLRCIRLLAVVFLFAQSYVFGYDQHGAVEVGGRRAAFLSTSGSFTLWSGGGVTGVGTGNDEDIEEQGEDGYGAPRRRSRPRRTTAVCT